MLTDWDKAWNHAKTGGTVRLTLEQLWSQDNSSVKVYLTDRAKRHLVATVAFYGRNPASFLLDLGPTLTTLKSPPSQQAGIGLVSGDKKKVNVKKMTVTLV